MSPQAPSPRILVVRVGAMGDVLHALPAVSWLRAQLPAARISWAVEPRWAPLLQADAAVAGTPGMPLVDLVHPVATRNWTRRPVSAATLRSIRELRRQLHDQQYDCAIDLQGSIRSAVLGRISGASVIVGSASPREAPARWLYTDRVSTTAAHVIDQAVQIVHAALAGLAPLPGRELQTEPGAATQPKSWAVPRAQLPTDPSSDAWTGSLLGEANGPVVFLAPTAGWGAKEWPPANFGQLAAALAGQGVHVLINSVGDDPVAAQVQAVAHSLMPIPPHGAIQIVPSTMSQLLALLRRTALVVAGDTGPLHLAAALGVPVIGLFGPTDPARNGPYFEPSAVFRDPGSVTSHRRHAIAEAGLQRISVDAVLRSAMEALGLA